MRRFFLRLGWSCAQRIFVKPLFFLTVLSACKTDDGAIDRSSLTELGAARADTGEWFSHFGASFSPELAKKGITLIFVPNYRMTVTPDPSSGQRAFHPFGGLGTGFLIADNGLMVTNFHIMEPCIDELHRRGFLGSALKEAELQEQAKSEAVLNRPERCVDFFAIPAEALAEELSAQGIEFVESAIHVFSRSNHPFVPSVRGDKKYRKGDLFMSILALRPENSFESILSEMEVRGSTLTAYPVSIVSNYPARYSQPKAERTQDTQTSPLEQAFDAVIVRVETGNQTFAPVKTLQTSLPRLDQRLFSVGFAAPLKTPRNVLDELASGQGVPTQDFEMGLPTFTTGFVHEINSAANLVSNTRLAPEDKDLHRDNMLPAGKGASGAPIFENTKDMPVTGVLYGGRGNSRRNAGFPYQTLFVSAARVRNHFFSGEGSGALGDLMDQSKLAGRTLMGLKEWAAVAAAGPAP